MADEDQLVTPPATNPPTPAPVTAPGTTGVAIAADPFADFRRQSAENARRFSTMYATPAQQRAVQAATRFMAQQGYQRDLQSGMPQADALAKWAPSLFFQPGVQVTPGTMASFIRAVRPQPVKAPTANPIDVTEARGIVSEMGKIQSALDDNPTGSVADDNRGKLQYLRGQLEAIRAKYNTNAAPPAPQRPQTRTAVSAPAGQGERIRVRSKDGKIGTIPASQLDEALAAGYTRAQ